MKNTLYACENHLGPIAWTPLGNRKNGGDIDQTAISNGMIIPDSDSRKLTEADPAGLSKEELRIARIEIYARHGRRFNDRELQEHFDSMEWYFPLGEDVKFDEGVLNEYEKYNAAFIGQYETK